jgi:ADP-ribose pyrophosphatase
MIIPVLKNGNLIMIEQYRHAVGKIFLEFPAGKLDPGENSEQAAHRELAEEIGYKTSNLKYLTSIHPVIGYSNEIIDLYVAHDLTTTKQNHQDDEFLIVKDVRVSDLGKMVFDHKITDVKTQIGIIWYLNSLKA